MARKSEPWWWEARQQWAVNLGGKRHVAPRSIGRHDGLAKEKWFESIKAELEREPVGSLSFAGLCDRYLEWDEKRIKTGHRDEAAHKVARIKLTRACALLIDGHEAGRIAADRFTAGHLEVMRDAWLAEGLGDTYVRELGGAVKAVFAWAAKDVGTRKKLIDANPVLGVTLPKVAQVDPRFANRGEAAAWLNWLRTRKKDRSYILLQRCLIRTGARPSEWTRATWGEIQWSQGMLVREKWKNRRKTGKVRRIFIPRRIRRALQRAFRKAESDPKALIFRTSRGVAWRSSNLSTITQRYRDAAIRDGVPLASIGPDRLTNYRWRHTAASTLLMDGVDIQTASELLGTSARMLQTTYGHILTNHLAQAAERLANRR